MILGQLQKIKLALWADDVTIEGGALAATWNEGNRARLRPDIKLPHVEVEPLGDNPWDAVRAIQARVTVDGR